MTAAPAPISKRQADTRTINCEGVTGAVCKTGDNRVLVYRRYVPRRPSSGLAEYDPRANHTKSSHLGLSDWIRRSGH